MKCLRVLVLAVVSVLALVLGRCRADVPDPLPLAQDIEQGIEGAVDLLFVSKEHTHSPVDAPQSPRK